MLAHDAQHRRNRQVEHMALTDENIRLRQRLGERFGPSNMIGRSSAMQAAQVRLMQVAPSDMTVLILGESGTGKELAAETIHHSSQRKDGPLVRVHCAALNENLLESELFGHEKGLLLGPISYAKDASKMPRVAPYF